MRSDLPAGVLRLEDAAKEAAGNETPGIEHWLQALLRRHEPMARSLVSGLDAATAIEKATRELSEENPTRELAGQDPVSLDDLVASIEEREGEDATISERTLAAAILRRAGYEVREPKKWRPSASGSAWTRSKPSHETLAKYGRELTREAREGRLPPVVGRSTEIDLMTEILLRRTKRNPLLVGPAGVGKTAIVEGLAQRIADDEVPDPLKGKALYVIQPSVLVAGAHMVGETEKRMKALVEEASDPNVILFIDEVHSIVGAGGARGTGDIASHLKPSLARGEIACIAATTDDEYRRFIQPDGALERRFQPIRVDELNRSSTLEVLERLVASVYDDRELEVEADTLEWIVEFAGRHMRNRRFLDKAIDLLEQCVAHATLKGKSRLEMEDARRVGERLVGRPPTIEEGLKRAREELEALLTDGDLEDLLARLRVSLHHYDMRPARPNAVLLVVEREDSLGARLAERLSGALLDASDRVVRLDFSRFVGDHHMSMLIGSAPGYVGYQDRVAIHEIAQMPWSVVLCENVDQAHWSIRDVWGQALRDGFLTDARGRHVYLSDTVVVMTVRAGSEEQGPRRIGGFLSATGEQADETGPAAGLRAAMRKRLGKDLVAECDLVIDGTGREVTTRPGDHAVLRALEQRYRGERLAVRWDESFRELVAAHARDKSERQIERWIDRSVAPVLLPYLKDRGAEGELVVYSEAGEVQARVRPGSEEA